MTVTIQIVSDQRRLLDIRNAWDQFIDMHTDNALMLSAFVGQYMEAARSGGWTPLLLVMSSDNVIIGIAPMKTIRKFGIRSAHLLAGPLLSSFLASDEWGEECVSKTIDFLFRTLRCQSVHLTLPAASPWIGLFKRKCQERKIHVSQMEGLGQSIVDVESSWDKFAKSRNRGKRFLKEIRRTEHNLSRAGSWRCLRFESDRAYEAFEQIMRIERTSWKQSYRTRRGVEADDSLLTIWAGLQRCGPAIQNLKWFVWFLEVNALTVAYILLLRYKNTAITVKTSYDDQYARFGPGRYLMYAGIRQLFEEEGVDKIDFITDLDDDVARTWVSTHRRRVDLTMTPVFGLMILHGSAFSLNARRNAKRVMSHWFFARVSQVLRIT